MSEYRNEYHTPVLLEEAVALMEIGPAQTCVDLTFGGGGHSRDSGCRLNGFYEDVVDKLLKAARDRM